jgi:hypothetical protein
MYQNKTETSWHNHFCRRKAIIITYSECVSLALIIQHAKRMRHIILLSVVRANVPYLINGTIFGEKSYSTWNVRLDFLYDSIP